MRKIFLLAVFLLFGCNSMERIHVAEKTTLQDVPRVEKLKWDNAAVPNKPEIVVREVDGTKYATLNNKGMADLIVLYKSAKDRTEETNSLIAVLNQTIEERNKLLELAKSEELRSNAYAKDLSAERDARIAEQRASDLQLTITRLVALIAIGFAL